MNYQCIALKFFASGGCIKESLRNDRSGFHLTSCNSFTKTFFMTTMISTNYVDPRERAVAEETQNISTPQSDEQNEEITNEETDWEDAETEEINEENE